MKKIVAAVLLFLLAVCFIFPIITSITNSFMESGEIKSLYGKGGTRLLSVIPGKITLNQYYTLLIERYQYLHMFWNSVKYSIIITLCHILISLGSAYVFAKVRFRGSELLFFIYIVVMMMPFQVTLVPNYIMVKKVLAIYDTPWAIILPGIFAPFGVFLLRQFMRYIPDEMIEAVVLESSSVMNILRIAIIPNVKPGIIALMVLNFAENWNMVEQPLVMLEDKLKYPLSIALNSLIANATDIAFSGSVVYMAPMIILYLYFEEQIIEGVKIMKL